MKNLVVRTWDRSQLLSKEVLTVPDDLEPRNLIPFIDRDQDVVYPQAPDYLRDLQFVCGDLNLVSMTQRIVDDYPVGATCSECDTEFHIDPATGEGFMLALGRHSDASFTSFYTSVCPRCGAIERPRRGTSTSSDEPIDAVASINADIFDKDPDGGLPFLTYENNGVNEHITWGGHVLWDDCDYSARMDADGRRFVETVEDCTARRLRKLLAELQAAKI